MRENKETFYARVVDKLSKENVLDIKLAYCLSKFAHRAQVRKEFTEGKPTRYFEHVRRVSIVLMDELKIFDKDMICTALLHDVIEDTVEIDAALIEHSFGSDVVGMVQALTNIPKEGYYERLSDCDDWRILTIKMCDRLDNLRSLMSPLTTVKFQNRKIKETKDHYFTIFDKAVNMCPPEYCDAISKIRDDIKMMIVNYEKINDFSILRTDK